MPKKTTSRRRSTTRKKDTTATSTSTPTTPITSSSSKKEKKKGEETIWEVDPQLDICLLEAIEVFPPLGYHKDFAIVNICATIKKVLNREVSVKEVVGRLDDLYDFTDLDKDAIDVVSLKSHADLEEEGISDVDDDFALPVEYMTDNV